MQSKPQSLLAMLPAALMFGSFGVLSVFSAWLASTLGVPNDVPIIERPNGNSWFFIFLGAMIFFMIAGVLLGWVLNALALRYVLKWPADKVRRVLLYSEVPADWLKSDVSTATPAETRVAQISQMGRWRYILTRGVLGFGTPLYVIFAIVPALRGHGEFTGSYFFTRAVIGAAIGALLGQVVWSVLAKGLARRSKKDQSNL